MCGTLPSLISRLVTLALVDIFGFFHKCLPPEDVDHLELAEVHTIIRDLWLARFDEELEAEVKSRRPGRPKSVKEQKLEDLKFRESEEYRTGLGT